MTVLRAADASFERAGTTLVEPFSLELYASGDASLLSPSAYAASIAARMCAAIVKPARGVIYVGDFETRLQPPQAKRLVGFVDAEGFLGNEHALRCEVAFRADVWGLDKTLAQERARAVYAALDGGPYARAVALALVADVALVVLDRPPDGVPAAIRRLVPAAGILRVCVAEAPVTAPPLAVAR